MVNVGTGNMLLQDDDMAVPHKGISLTFRRTYNSQSQHDTAGTDGTVPSMYGNGWTNTFDAHLSGSRTGTISVWDVDGARYDYTVAADGVTFIPPPGQHATLVTDGGYGFLWTKKSGTTYYFWAPDAATSWPTSVYQQWGAYAGRTYQIIGRNRNTSITLSYGWDNNSSAAGGKINMIIAYAESGLAATLYFADIGGHRLLSSITFPDNATSVDYGYDTLGNLVNVSRPPNNAVWARPSHGYGYAQQGSGGSIMSWADSPRWAQGGGDGAITGFAYTGSSPATATINQIGRYATVNPSIPDGTNSGALQSGYPTAAYEYYDEYYATGGSAPTFRDSDGHAANWVFDSHGRPTQTQECTATTGGSCTGTWLVSNETWDSDNNLATEVDPRGNETYYLYDPSGNTTVVAGPYTTTSQGSFLPTKIYDYDANHNVVAYCDENEVHQAGVDYLPVSFSVEANDSLCSSQMGSVPHWHATYSYPSYEPYGELTSMTTPLGYTRRYAYAASQQGGSDYGLPTSVTGDTFPQSDGSSITPTQASWYDAQGNLRCFSKGQGTSVLSYDALGRLVSMADPDDSSANATSVCGKNTGQPGWNTQTTYTYNPDGSPQSSQTPPERAANVVTSFAYDVDGNVVRETHHFGWNAGPVAAGVTTKWYDGADRLVEVAQPQDPADTTYGGPPWLTRYLYDLSAGQSVAMLGAGATSPAYGNLYKTQEWGGHWLDLKASAFDALNRETKNYSFVPGTNAATVNVTTMTYDNSTSTLGLLSSKTDGVGEITDYAYNERGAASSVTFRNDGGITPPRWFTYDADARVSSIQNPSYGIKTFQYDSDGRLVAVNEPSSGSLSSPARIGYDYYPDGSRKDVTAASALLNANPLLRYTYRSDGLNVTTSMVYGAAVYGFTSSYTDGGRITSRNDPFSGTPLPNSGSSGARYTPTTWSYDTAGQLTTLMMPYAYSYTGITHDPEGTVVGWRASLGLNNDIVATFTNTVRGENIKQVQTPTTPRWIWEPPTPWEASPAHGVLVPKKLRDGFETPTIDPYNALITKWSGYSSVQNVDGSYTSCFNSSTDTYDGASRLVSRYVVGDPRCGTSSSTTNTWSYDADNHTMRFLPGDSSYTCNIIWGPDGHAIQNPCAQALDGTARTDSLHYDGNDILFVTDSRGSLKGIRVANLGDLVLAPTSTIFWVPDRDFAGVIATAHSNVGYDGITFGENTAWSGGACHYNDGGLVNPVPSCNTPLQGGTVTLEISSVGNGALNGSSQNRYSARVPSYAKSHLDGIDWAPDVTLQGARSRDSTTGTWTTPDAYAGDVHDPMSQKPFMWNRNNPYEYSDPTGFIIEFHGANAEQHYNNAIDYFASHHADEAVELLRRLRDDPNHTFIVSITSAGARDGINADIAGIRGDMPAINWDIRAGLSVERGIQSPAMGLLHEAAHAWRIATDRYGYDRARNFFDSDYGDREEKRVIDGVERRTAQIVGEPSRYSHNDGISCTVTTPVTGRRC